MGELSLPAVAAAVAFAGVAALAGCRGGERGTRPVSGDAGVGAAAAPREEVEPNDTVAAAQALAPGTTVRGSCAAGDVDLYLVRIEASGGQLVDAWLEGGEGLSLRVRRADGGKPVEVRAPERVLGLGASRGDYLIEVSGGGDSAGTYALTVAARPATPGAEWEPNDAPAAAMELRPRQAEGPAPDWARPLQRFAAGGALASAADVDCYRIPLEVPAEGARMRLSLQPPAEVTARLVVYADEGAAPILDAQGLAAGETLVAPALGMPAWAPALIACVSAASGASYASRYRLEVESFSPKRPFEFEPNDAVAAASALPRGIAQAGHLTPGDRDWYRISSEPQASVRVSVTPLAGVAVTVTLYDQAMTRLAGATGAAGAGVEVEAVQAVFAEVTAASGGSTGERYEITARSGD